MRSATSWTIALIGSASPSGVSSTFWAYRMGRTNLEVRRRGHLRGDRRPSRPFLLPRDAPRKGWRLPGTGLPAGARTVEVVSYDGDALGKLERIHPDGLFAGPVAEMVPYRLLVAWEGGGEAEVEDPYWFPAVLGEQDLYLFGEGNHLRLYEKLGAHPIEFEGVAGTSFAVWAPNARRVSVIGDFNFWNG